MMNFRITLLAAALSALAIGPVYAGGAGGCDYSGGKYQSTSVQPQEQSQAAKKLASLSMPAGSQDQVAPVTEKATAPSDDSTVR